MKPNRSTRLAMAAIVAAGTASAIESLEDPLDSPLPAEDVIVALNQGEVLPPDKIEGTTPSTKEDPPHTVFQDQTIHYSANDSYTAVQELIATICDDSDSPEPEYKRLARLCKARGLFKKAAAA